jgi:glutaconate CoA-transferase subunit B
VTADEVKANTGFEMLFGGRVTETPEPSDEELRILREEVDPLGLILGKH